MKKILIGAITALALLFGMTGCSGDLHDVEVPKEEPVTIADASWWYYDLTVYGDNGEGKVILKGDGQSTDTSMPAFAAKDGGVFYYTADTSKKDSDGKYALLVSHQKDEPVYTPVPGTIRFYFYTNATSCNFYCWDNDDAFASPEWSKAPSMEKIETLPSIFIDGCRIINATTVSDGTPVYFMGEWVPGNNGKISGTCIGVCISGTAFYKFPEPVEKTDAALKVQVRILNTPSDLLNGTGNKPNGQEDFTSSNKDEIEMDGTHYIWTLDCSDYSCKLEEADIKVTLKYKVTSLTAGNEAWINGEMWGSSWPNGWPIGSWNTTPNSTLAAAIPVADAGGTATFDSAWDCEIDAKLGDTLKYEFKVIACSDSDWADADVLNPSSNLVLEFEPESTGTYLVTIDASSKVVTCVKQ